MVRILRTIPKVVSIAVSGGIDGLNGVGENRGSLVSNRNKGGE